MERLTEKIMNKHTGEVLAYKAKYLRDGETVQKLGQLEDLEEQGKLPKVPCAVGDTVYCLYTNENKESEITEMKVGCIEPFGAIRNHKGVCEIWNVYAEADYAKEYFKFSDFEKTVFPSREEAKTALKEFSTK